MFTQEKGMCINCQEYKSVVFNFGVGICKDPECIFIHNIERPDICTCCGDTLPPNIIHHYCGSGKLKNRYYLKEFFRAYRAYREMGNISRNG
jgi:hypothetical protein